MTTGYPEPNDARTDGWRSLTARLADLCKTDPARFAAVVRRSDALVAAGVGRDEAYGRVLNAEEAPPLDPK